MYWILLRLIDINHSLLNTRWFIFIQNILLNIDCRNRITIKPNFKDFGCMSVHNSELDTSRSCTLDVSLPRADVFNLHLSISGTSSNRWCKLQNEMIQYSDMHGGVIIEVSSNKTAVAQGRHFLLMTLDQGRALYNMVSLKKV